MNIKPINISDDDIIIIHTNIINPNSKIWERLNELNRHCWNAIIPNKCGGVYPNCESIIIIYIPGISDYLEILQEELDNKKIINIIEENSNQIFAFLLVIIFENFLEIYNICTHKDFRGKEIQTRIFEYLIYKHIKDKMWVGIIPNNPKFIMLINLYTKYGFVDNIKITNKSYSGNIFQFDFISLECNVKKIIENLTNEQIENAREKILKLRREYIKKEFRGYEYKLILPYETLKKLNNFLSPEIEIGGILTYDNDILRPVKKFEGKYGSVNVPVEMINFHTHPTDCYIKECWLSIDDITYVINGYEKGVRLHFVVTKEGIYIIQLTPEFQFILSLIDNKCKIEIVNRIIEDFKIKEEKEERKYEKNDKLIELLGIEFDCSREKLSGERFSSSEIENIAKKNLKYSLKQLYAEKILKNINNYTFNKILENDNNMSRKLSKCIKKHVDKNINLFEVRFINWSEIEIDKNMYYQMKLITKKKY